jgi:hypothetical protein
VVVLVSFGSTGAEEPEPPGVGEANKDVTNMATTHNKEIGFMN